jgi:hypothetical protein
MSRMKDEWMRRAEEDGAFDRSDEAEATERTETADVLKSEDWQVRIGQIETVLRFFGSLCSVSIERTNANGSSSGVDTVYMQAQRVDGGTEIEMTGNQYLAVGPLSPAQEALMVALGWTAPDIPASPNFTRFVTEEDGIHDVAVGIARAFATVYGVAADAQWVVSPPEFGNDVAGLTPFEVVDLDDDGGASASEADLMAPRRRILRKESGATLIPVILSDAVTWDDLIDAGLPRGDRLAEMAMLHRTDCPVAFLRKSPFHLQVLDDPTLPTATAQAILAAEPTPWELKKLAKRDDVPAAQVRAAATRGARLANWRGRSGREYLALGLVPTTQLASLSEQQDDDAVGMLRHPRCLEDIVLKHILARSARVRYTALSATKDRNLAIDSALIRLAGELPMTERPNTVMLLAPRVRKLVDEILAAR